MGIYRKTSSRCLNKIRNVPNTQNRQQLNTKNCLYTVVLTIGYFFCQFILSENKKYTVIFQKVFFYEQIITCVMYCSLNTSLYQQKPIYCTEIVPPLLLTPPDICALPRATIVSKRFQCKEDDRTLPL